MQEVETVRGFCYFGNRVNASGGCLRQKEWFIGVV